MASITARLQTPADVNGNRYDIDPITNAEAVIFDNGKILPEIVQELASSSVNAGMVFSDSDHKPDGPVIWGEIWSDVHNK